MKIKYYIVVNKNQKRKTTKLIQKDLSRPYRHFPGVGGGGLEGRRGDVFQLNSLISADTLDTHIWNKMSNETNNTLLLNKNRALRRLRTILFYQQNYDFEKTGLKV